MIRFSTDMGMLCLKLYVIPLFVSAGFSKQMVEILNKHGVSFSSFDIFSDEEVRQGLKTYSNWPTYPQLYVAGELIGGLDIVKVRNREILNLVSCHRCVFLAFTSDFSSRSP